jgi:hypothetical protein
MRHAGFFSWKIVPYYSNFPETKLSASGAKKFGVNLFERAANVVEWLFPLLAGGWIVTARVDGSYRDGSA